MLSVAVAVDLLVASCPALEAVIREGFGGHGQMLLLPRGVLPLFFLFDGININKPVPVVQDSTGSKVSSCTPPQPLCEVGVITSLVSEETEARER